MSSWVMAITHLGLLGPRRSIGWPNAVSLARANLPVTGERLGCCLGLVALASDKVDGTLARRAGSTMFGFYADSVADAVFWTWFGAGSDPNRVMRAAAVAAWVAPVATVGVVSIAKGKMVESPRPAVLRPAAAMQGVLALRALVSQKGMAPTANRVSRPTPPRRNA
jgi:phosphatidylglycerophosphate synthase